MDGGLAVLIAGSGGCAFIGSFMAISSKPHGWARESRSVPAKPKGLWGRSRVAASLRLKEQQRERRVCALREMPTLLDILTLGLTAGLSFDSSVELYCTRYRNSLAQALGEALLSWRIGLKSREEALEDLADSLDISAVRRFSATVSEALAFGSPLADALERQAEVIRDERRTELEEEMERLPVKMLIPLGTLIVPAMLLAILGPLLAPALGRT